MNKSEMRVEYVGPILKEAGRVLLRDLLKK